MPTTDVRDRADRTRYELVVDGEVVGIADYVREGDRLVLPHTEIEPARRGQGLGDVLVRSDLDDARSRTLTVVPACWFVAEFIDRNHEYAELLAA